jgi:hypothetical protein
MFIKRFLALVLVGALVFSSTAVGFADESAPGQQAPAPSVRQTPEQLQQLVAPVALYPDELVAEVFAAATYPDQVVEADRWLQDHKNLQGQQLGNAIDKQPWDSSVKALAEFPSVLANMDKNLSWTSSLGEAYMNQQQDVMNAVQVMRQRAQQSGNLNSNSQQKVTKQGNTIVIEPAAPDVVYMPTYDPWIAYGGPVVAWPGWYSYPGLYVATPGISFGFGFGVGFFGGFGWGWHHWGLDWGHRTIVMNHRTYISHSTIINRNRFSSRNHFSHARSGFRSAHNSFASHGRDSGTHFGASRGFNHAGMARRHSFAGRGGVGGAHAGGGFHGSGGRR